MNVTAQNGPDFRNDLKDYIEVVDLELNKELRTLSDEIIVLTQIELAKGLWTFRICADKGNEGVKSYLKFIGFYRNGIIDFLSLNGYFKRFYDESKAYFFLHEEDNIIHEVQTVEIKDFINNAIDRFSDLTIEYNGMSLNVSVEILRETFKKQAHLFFTNSFLELLPNHVKPILKDDEISCYKLFYNGVVHITSKTIKILCYSDLDGYCVWKNHIKPHHFKQKGTEIKSHFEQFIINISNGQEERISATKSAFGYLSHAYNPPSRTQAVLLYDENIAHSKTPEGGTGKGVFAKGIQQMTAMVKIDGKKFDGSDRFCFQQVSNSTQVVWFDDVKSDLSFDRFNSLLSDGWNIEKKNQPEIFIPPEHSPKTLISSNLILDCEGSTRKRRQFIIEFGNYYQRKIIQGHEEPIRAEHSCIFFSNDWTEYEWDLFYGFMLECIQLYLCEGLKQAKPKNMAINRLRQKTSEEFADWIQLQTFENGQEIKIKDYFDPFKQAFYNGSNDLFTQRRFTDWLKLYAQLNGLSCKIRASHGYTYLKFGN